MTKKHRKEKTPPPTPISRRYTLYTRDTSGDVLTGVVLVVFFAFGIGVIYEQQYLIALFLFSLIGLAVYSKFKEVQKLDIFEGTILIEYLDFTDTYRPEDIETIEWSSALVIDNYIFSRGYYKLTPVLLIQTRTGKKIRIPPPGGFDIQKSLLAWRDKYQIPSGNQVIANE
jgi:hypothetical protein